MKENSIQQMDGFYKELINTRLSEDSIVFQTPEPEVIEKCREDAVPLINISPPIVKYEDFFVIMKQISEVIQNYQPDLNDEITKIINLLPDDPSGKKAFVSKAIIPGSSFTYYFNEDVNQDIFDFMRNYSVKPFMRAYGKYMSSLYDLEEWLKGFCPVCGSYPNMALLEKEEGKRYLSCGWCETKWRFNRLGCPYCLHDESQFFTLEGVDKYRVYFCEKCRGYLKTVDETNAGNEAVDLLWEDINTVQLDFIAMREGFSNQKADLALNDSEK